jgi:hypothetical protein
MKYINAFLLLWIVGAIGFHHYTSTDYVETKTTEKITHQFIDVIKTFYDKKGCIDFEAPGMDVMTFCPVLPNAATSEESDIIN